MLERIITEYDGDPNIEAAILKLDAPGVIKLFQNYEFPPSFMRRILGSLLCSNKSWNYSDLLLANKFLLAHDLNHAKTLNNLEDNLYEYFVNNIGFYFQINRGSNIYKNTKQTESMLEVLLSHGDDISLYKKLIETIEYHNFFDTQYIFSEQNNVFCEKDFLFITKDFMNVHGKKEIFFPYFKNVFNLIKERDFNPNIIKSFVSAIRFLECETYINEINISGLNQKEFGLYENICSFFNESLSSKYLKYLFINKIKFYQKDKILLNHICSLNSNDYLYKDAFIYAIENQLFDQKTLFVKDTSDDENDDLLGFLYLHNYKSNKIINILLLKKDKIDIYAYLNEFLPEMNWDNLKRFLEPDDFYIFTFYSKKMAVSDADFFEFFVDNLEVCIDENGRIGKDFIEIFSMNFKI